MKQSEKNFAKQRKKIFAPSKKSTSKKKALKKASNRAKWANKSWTKVVDRRLKRYTEGLLKPSTPFQKEHILCDFVLRLTASRFYKFFDHQLIYNQNEQYPYKIECDRYESRALDLFMKRNKASGLSFFRPGLIVHPKYFFMACVPDALVCKNQQIYLVEIKVRLSNTPLIIDGLKEPDISVLNQRWLDQICFSLIVCELVNTFLIIYDKETDSIEITAYFRPLHPPTYINAYIEYFVERIFLRTREFSRFSEAVKQRGQQKIMLKMWNMIQEQDQRLKKMEDDGKEFFHNLYERMPFVKYNK